ncbi:MAG: hypothetical protein ACJ716_00475 [Marmoricola sp.]
MTDPSRIGPASYKDGILKLLVFDPSIALAFSGAIDAALEGARVAHNAHSAGKPVDEIVALLAAHSGQHDCSFIVAASSPPLLFEIKDGRARVCSAAWLGDHRALEVYQAAFASAPDHSSALPAEQLERSGMTIESLRVASAHTHAFGAALKAGLPGVGLLSIDALPSKAGFEYGTSMQVYYPRQTIPANTSAALRFGTATHGGFIVSTMGAKDGPAAAIYFPHGKFGILSSPLTLQGNVTIHAATQAQFVERIAVTYGLSMMPGISVDPPKPRL